MEFTRNERIALKTIAQTFRYHFSHSPLLKFILANLDEQTQTKVDVKATERRKKNKNMLQISETAIERKKNILMPKLKATLRKKTNEEENEREGILN